MKRRSDSFRTFAIAFVGGMVAFAAWRLVPALWPFVWPTLAAIIVLLAVLNSINAIRYWLAGRKRSRAVA